MPKDEFDHEDPMELVSLPMPGAPPGADAALEREMARCLAEEYVRMGTSDEELLAMFRNPFYRVLHEAYRSLGEEAVRSAIAQARARWVPASK